MKHSIVILILILAGVLCHAQNQKQVQNANKNLQDIISTLESESNSLSDEIENAKTTLEKLRNNSGTQNPETDLDNYLKRFVRLDEMGNFVKPILLRYPSSDRANAYLLVVDMMNSLNEVFNEETNAWLLERAQSVSGILPEHEAEYKELTGLVSDYNYYMYELDRLFFAADKDGYNKTHEELAKNENAEEILKIPYLNRILERYIQRMGKLEDNDKRELKKACPDAFMDF